jgi:cell division protein FtsW (lipid II flippase)
MTSQFAIYFIFVLARLERVINKHIITIIYLVLVLVLVLKTSFQNCGYNDNKNK